ncbi:MAG: glycosyltransferase family 39 protein [Spirochaetaceae bacterium]|nr:glycosyltransferase family 39 protein [Spirochaetaceae bacterium]
MTICIFQVNWYYEQPTTDNRQPTTDNRQPTTDNRLDYDAFIAFVKPLLQIFAFIRAHTVLFLILDLAVLFSCFMLRVSPKIRSALIYAGGMVRGHSLRSEKWHRVIEHFALDALIFFLILSVLTGICLKKKINPLRICFTIYGEIANLINKNRLGIKCVFGVLMLVTTVFFIAHNITNPNFWFDEAGQFWISKGLDHISSPPFSQNGSIIDAIKKNTTNLDPGGFTILLHLVLLLGNQPFFLRILPVFFFFTAVFLVIKIAGVWRANDPLVILSGFILFSSSLILHYAFEVRAYSMEMCAMLSALYFCYKKERIYASKKYALHAGIILAVLISSRYSAVFSVLPFFIILFFDSIKKRAFLRRFVNFLLLAAPLCVIGVLIILFMLRFQMEKILGSNITPPSYARGIIKTEGIGFLFSKPSLIIIPFFILFLLYIIAYKKQSTRKYTVFILFVFIQNSIFIILSALGKYPYQFTERFNITSVTLFIIALIPLVFIIKDMNRSFNIIGTFVFLALACSWMYKGITYHRGVFWWGSIYENFIKENIDKDSKILTTRNSKPVLMYLFEYGGLRGHGSYPHGFEYFNERSGDINDIFSLDDSKKGRLDTNIDINSYDYIILDHFNQANLSKAYFINLGEWKKLGEDPSFMLKRIKAPEAADGK